jgi:hypothetical protein
MTEMMSDVEHAEEPKPGAGLDGLDEQLVESSPCPPTAARR